MEQLKLDLFTNEPIESAFDTSIERTNRMVYTRRDASGTFLMIGSLNFLGKHSGVEFRFDTGDFNGHYQVDGRDVIMPELAKMSLDRITEFAFHVVNNLELGKYKWSYENRCKIYNSLDTVEENMRRNYDNKCIAKTMVEFCKITRELDNV